MRVVIKRHCDEAMTDSVVVDFVTSVYQEAEKKSSARPAAERTKTRIPVGNTWIELSVGECIGLCSAELVDEVGVLGAFNRKTHLFHPEGGSAPYILE